MMGEREDQSADFAIGEPSFADSVLRHGSPVPHVGPALGAVARAGYPPNVRYAKTVPSVARELARMLRDRADLLDEDIAVLNRGIALFTAGGPEADACVAGLRKEHLTEDLRAYFARTDESLVLVHGDDGREELQRLEREPGGKTMGGKSTADGPGWSAGPPGEDDASYLRVDEFTSVPSVHVPGLLPELRAFLRGMWEDGRPFALVAPAMGHRPGVDTATYVAWERRTLDRASLWWVAEPMVDVLLAAAASVPDDVRGEDVVPLAPHGLVVLERPWRGVSSTPGQSAVTVHAFAWGPATLPPLEDRPDLGGSVACVSLSSYSCFPPEAGKHMAPEYGVHGQYWAPLGRSDWPLADPVGREPWPMDDQTRASFVEDRRVLCALMTLLAHDGIATQTVQVAARAVRRRMARAGVPGSDRPYRIVALRKIREADGTVSDAGERLRREHDHRWIVSGHWKRQPCGPKHSLRRLIWIDPYVAGPEDQPLRTKETIHAWKR